MKFYKKETTNNLLYTDKLSLSDIANKYETDKGTADSDDLSWGSEHKSHKCMHYTKTYEKYMNSKILEDVSMMEIGICDKRFPYASTQMWMSYFKNLDLYAVDNFWGHKIDNKIKDVEKLNSQGINFIYADQGSFEDWDEINSKFPDKFDFLVEDGSHWPNHMMVSLWKSINCMKEGGYYFMEDIQNPLKSRGWFKYDNALIAQELLETLSTGTLYSSFLNDDQNKSIQQNFTLVDLVLDPYSINYLAVFKKIKNT